jgi:hypothetical protein
MIRRCGRNPPAVASLIAIACCGSGASARAEPVIGQFELKTLDGAALGEFEFQSQNAWSWGHPPRQIAGEDGDLELDENSITRQRYALELEGGLTRFLKMRAGVEFEQERMDEPPTLTEADAFGDLRLSELGIELIAVLRARENDGAGLGVVAELEKPVDDEEATHLTLGPIVEFQAGPWFAAAVPMLVRAFGGREEAGRRTDDKWDFAYAAQLMHRFSARWSLALEGYGTVERLGDTGYPSDAADRFGDFDQHRAGGVLYWTLSSVTVGAGLLEGLNANTPDHTVKLSVEVDF